MLYVCATPIGNLEDITIRTLNVLSEVDYIACEDTRRTIKLLNHYNIKKKLVSFNEHSEYRKKDFIIDDLKKGLNIALVSDAGMPGIQDPGQILIKDVISNNLEYTVLPGASALITAIVGSGLAKDEFIFLGFLPRKTSEREKILKKYSKLNIELILYEAPHRFLKLLDDLYIFWGNRDIVVVREISKKYEEYNHTTILEAKENYKNIKGEIVLIISGDKSEVNIESGENITDIINECRKQGMSNKDIVKYLVKEKNISKNEAYKIVIK